MTALLKQVVPVLVLVQAWVLVLAQVQVQVAVVLLVMKPASGLRLSCWRRWSSRQHAAACRLWCDSRMVGFSCCPRAQTWSCLSAWRLVKMLCMSGLRSAFACLVRVVVQWLCVGAHLFHPWCALLVSVLLGCRELDRWSSQGLRTLVMGVRQLSETEYDGWWWAEVVGMVRA